MTVKEKVRGIYHDLFLDIILHLSKVTEETGKNHPSGLWSFGNSRHEPYSLKKTNFSFGFWNRTKLESYSIHVSYKFIKIVNNIRYS
jgi:hypothetical protein